MGAELGLTGLVGLTMGGSRLEAELVQIVAPWLPDSSRPRLGSWLSISSRQPVHGQRGGQRGALPPSSGGSPPLKVALVRAAQRAPVAHEKRQGLGQGAGARTGLVPPAPSPPAQLSRARHGRPRGSPSSGCTAASLRLENPHVCGERGGEGGQGGQEEPLQLRLGALGLLPGTNRWH